TAARTADSSKSPSPTVAWASNKNTNNASSNASFASTKPAPDPPAAPAWDWPSSNTSPPTTAAKSTYGANPAPAPPSPCASPPTPTTPNTQHARYRHPSTWEGRHDQSAHRGRRGRLRRPVGLPAAQGGLLARGRRDRIRGVGGIRPQRRRHRATRSHAARDERHRRVQAATLAVRCPGDHGDRPGQ